MKNATIKYLYDSAGRCTGALDCNGERMARVVIDGAEQYCRVLRDGKMKYKPNIWQQKKTEEEMSPEYAQAANDFETYNRFVLGFDPIRGRAEESFNYITFSFGSGDD